MAAPLVSCIIPVRDGVAFLADAIESVLAQDHRPLEVLVVDGVSTDGSADVARAHGEPVRVLENPDRSAPTGRNLGIAAARGELLAFLDADDLYRPGKLAGQVAHLAARPEVDVSLCRVENFWEPGLEDEEARYRAAGRMQFTHVLDALLARRRVFDLVGPMDPALPGSDQADWFARLGDHPDLRVEVVDLVGVSRRMHPASMTHAQPSMEPWLDLVKRRLDARRAGS